LEQEEEMKQARDTGRLYRKRGLAMEAVMKQIELQSKYTE
jgi:hypothetical protein